MIPFIAYECTATVRLFRHGIIELYRIVSKNFMLILISAGFLLNSQFEARFFRHLIFLEQY